MRESSEHHRVDCGTRRTFGFPKEDRDRLIAMAIAFVVALFLLFNGSATDAFAQWASDGVRLDMFGSAQPSAVCSDGQGGAIAVWPGPGGTGPTNLYVQSVTSSGHIRWAPGGVPLTPRLGLQQNPSIATDNAGGAFVAWEERRYNFKAIYAQHVLAGGAIAPSWPDTGLLVSTRDDQLDELAPVVVPDGSGGFYCAWYDLGQVGAAHNWIVFAQHINADGTRPAGWIDGGNIVRFGPGDGGQPSAASDGGGNLFIAWTNYVLESFSSNVYAQRINPDGTMPWSASGLASTVVSKKAWPRVIADGSGGAVTTWYDLRSDLPGSGMYLQRLTSGFPATGWDPGGAYLEIAPYPNGPSTILADGTGGAIVAVASSNQIRAARVSGDQSAGFVRVLSSSSPQKEPPRAVPDGLGGAIVVWEDVGLGLKTAHAQRVTATGLISSGWPTNGSDNINNDVDGVGSLAQPAVTEGELGQAIVVYPANLNSTRMLKIGADGTTVPVLVSLADVHATPTEVRLRWYVVRSSPAHYEVRRSEAGSAWAALGEPQETGDGFVTFVDSSVEAGQRYGYQLAIKDADGETLSEVIWADVPGNPELRLQGFTRSPAQGVPEVSFSLPDTGPATLVVFDLAGRQQVRLEVGQLGPGFHTIRLSSQTRLAPSMYFLKLTQGDGVRFAKGTIVR